MIRNRLNIFLASQYLVHDFLFKKKDLNPSRIKKPFQLNITKLKCSCIAYLNTLSTELSESESFSQKQPSLFPFHPKEKRVVITYANPSTVMKHGRNNKYKLKLSIIIPFFQ